MKLWSVGEKSLSKWWVRGMLFSAVLHLMNIPPMCNRGRSCLWVEALGNYTFASVRLKGRGGSLLARFGMGLY